VIQVIVASRNRHKVQEIRDLLGGGFEVTDLSAFPGAPEVVEDAPTFEGNAKKKALALAGWLLAQNRFPPGRAAFVLADDSGLEVDALGGAPGVLSARFAAADHTAGNSPDAENNAKLLRLLEPVPLERRTARFRCVLALAPVAADAALGVRTCEGACEGRIQFQTAGAGGFGYDPLFMPDGYSETFAELGTETKNRMSHRARALERLKDSFQL
jgi:XTP/dITP diphosphohydrolase